MLHVFNWGFPNCRYKLADAPASDDLQRLRATGSYSLAGSYSSTCQTIADVAAANSFLSTLILLACSNRSIELVDAATLQVGWRAECPYSMRMSTLAAGSRLRE